MTSAPARIGDLKRLRLPVLPESASPLASGGASQRGSHRLAMIAECPRAWYLRWVRRFVPLYIPKHLIEGTLCHLQLAYYFAARTPCPPPWYGKVSLEDALAIAGRGYPEAVALSHEFIQAYAAGGHGDRWASIGVEVEFAATIGEIRGLFGPVRTPDPDDGQTVTARIDLVAAANGLIWLVDHKGTMRGYGDHLPRWNDDGEWRVKWQFEVQLLVVRAAIAVQARQTGEPVPEVGGIIVQRFKRKLPFDTDANPAPFSARVNRDAVHTLQRQVRAETAIVSEIQAAIARGEDMETWVPVGHLWSCFSWGRACDYRPLCLTEDKGAWLAVSRGEYKVEEAQCGG